MDLAGHEAAAAGHPCGGVVVAVLDPDMPIEHVRAVLGFEVGGAVLEPEEVARRVLGGRGRGGAPVADLAPLQHGRAEADAGQVADRVHAHLGVVGARLDHEVAVARAVGELLAGEPGHAVGEHRRHPPSEPEAVPAVLVPEERRAEAEGDREPAGRIAPPLAGVLGRAVGVGVRLAAHQLAGAHLLGGHRPLGEQGLHVLDVVGVQVEGREVQVVLGGRDDPGLLRPAEGVGRLRVGGAGVVRGPADDGAAHPCGTDQARQPGAGHEPTTGEAAGASPAGPRLLAGGRVRAGGAPLAHQCRTVPAISS